MSSNQININNLSKIYDNGFEALKNINLNIKKGENKSLDKNTPTNKLLEKSGNGNIKNPATKPIIIEPYAVFSSTLL